MSTKAVYKAISAVMRDIGEQGISKDRKNAQQGFSFRGIDDVYNALNPLLAKHGLIIEPYLLSREVTERVTGKGSVLFSVVVDMQYSFTAVEDGSSVIVRVCGEAMDSGDKATNKAMSAALKYCCLQTFMIPTEAESPDADTTTHDDITPRHEAPRPSGSGPTLVECAKALREAATMDELRRVWAETPEVIQTAVKPVFDAATRRLGG